jgi:CHASE2 domain-containing sensor protein
MMRSRFDEGKDDRILIVEITEADVQAQNAVERGGRSLSDRALKTTIDKLKKYYPRVIGLDIYRETPLKEEYADLNQWMKTSSKFIGICKVAEDENPGVAAPLGIPQTSLGFSDVVEDNDSKIRRHLLAMAALEPCNTDKSFSFQLATRYLAKQNIQLKLNVEDKSNQNNNLIFPYLSDHSGGYSQIDSRGYQVMLNWRMSPEIATRITLSDVLNDRLSANLVKDKIVIIGTTAESFKDYWLTPLSATTSPIQKTPGVIIQAHMVSQIISTALDNRPLLWVWSKWSEALWIYCWAIVGGMLVWRTKSSLHLALTLAIAQILLYYLCYILLIQGAWVPFVPAILAIVCGSGSVFAYTSFQVKYKGIFD